MPLSDTDIRGIKVQTQPSNYGINHVAVGVASTINNVLTSSITSTSFSFLTLTRGVQRHPEGVYSAYATTGVTSSVRFFYTSTDVKVAVGDTVVAGPSLYSGTILSGVVTSAPSARKFGFTTTNNTVYGADGNLIIFPRDTTLVASFAPPTESTWATSPITELGIPATFHAYDTGATSGTTGYTTNPGKGITSTALQGSEAFYSAHIIDGTNGARVVGKYEEIFVKDNATTAQLVDYLPSLYKVNSRGTYNQDLEDFLSLFAFQYDKWRTDIDLIFNRGSIDKIDSKLLKLLLNQFGFDYSKISDVKFARSILSNLVSIYQNKGSTYGIRLASEALTGYDVTATASSVNLIPDQNSASFTEIKADILWTVDGSVSPTSAIASATAANKFLPIPAMYVVGSPHYGWDSTTGAVATTATVKSSADNGMLYVKADNGSGEFRIISSPRFAITSTTTAINTHPITPKYVDFRAGDYIISTTGAITYGDYLDSVTNYTLVLNGTTKASIPANTRLYMSQTGPELTSAASKMIPVKGSTRYTFSVDTNSGGYQVSPISPFIYWYKSDGSAASTALSTASAQSTTSTTNWFRVSVTATSPSDAFYAAPGWSLTRTSTVASQSGYFFDAAQFEVGATSSAFVNPNKLTIIATSNTLANASGTGILKYNLKDLQTSSFLPTSIFSASYSILEIKNIGTSSGSSGYKNINLPDPISGITQEYSTATVILNETTDNIKIGQTLSIKGNIGGTGNQINYAIVIGVISSSEYRILKISSTTAMVATTAISTTGIIPPMPLYTNYVNKPSITIS